MGLSTKEVSGDHGLDWSQSLLQSGTWELPKPPSTRRQQQQTEPTLECPRCGSTNTKFCYYNNYNKLQPRHFCKACKRHWTKGGTLRNIPVGGGRKNKRLKASNTVINTAPTSTSASTTSHANMGHKSLQRWQDLSLPLANQKDLSNPVYQSLISPQSSVPFDAMNSINNSHNKTAFLGDLGGNGNSTMSSSSLLSSFDTGPSSIMSSCQSLNAYNCLRKLETLEDSTITTTNTTMPSTTCSILSEPWHIPTMSTIVADVPSYWNWNDIDSSVSAEFSIPWDEAEIKP